MRSDWDETAQRKGRENFSLPQQREDELHKKREKRGERKGKGMWRHF